MHMKVRGQLVGIGLLFPPDGSQGSTSGCQAGQQFCWAFSPTLMYAYNIQSINTGVKSMN